jgi:A/G-specific adenine glycosylase
MPHTPSSALLAWAGRRGRNPPWRKVRDAYALGVAEVLLQKTKGKDVEPVWSAVLRAYPTAKSLANSRRARLRRIVMELGLGNQRTERLRSMGWWVARGGAAEEAPGLGPYGSAILGLALGQRSAGVPVDGNVARVICRYKTLKFERGEARKKPEVRSAVEGLFLKRKSTAAKLRVIYALVDLGATVCTPGRPNCAECPLREWCEFPSDP